jgi:hypothetical protein
LLRKPEGKKPSGRPRSRWNSIKMDLKGTGWEGVDWVHRAQTGTSGGAPANMVINFWVP